MLEQPRRQGNLVRGTETQPGLRAPFHHQLGSLRRGWQFDLHKRRQGFRFALALTPAAKGGVVECVLSGKGRGGQAAPVKDGQQLGALGGSRTPSASKTVCNFHRPHLPRAAHAE